MSLSSVPAEPLSQKTDSSRSEKVGKIQNVLVFFPEVQHQTLNNYMKYNLSFEVQGQNL